MPNETTQLTPLEQALFQKWISDNKIPDVDHPDSHYDYRGFFKQEGPKPVRFGIDHFTDTFKQHGHPTFSQESKYSRGPSDGGMWVNDTFIPQPKLVPSHSTVPKKPSIFDGMDHPYGDGPGEMMAAMPVTPFSLGNSSYIIPKLYEKTIPAVEGVMDTILDLPGRDSFSGTAAHSGGWETARDVLSQYLGVRDGAKK